MFRSVAHLKLTGAVTGAQQPKCFTMIQVDSDNRLHLLVLFGVDVARFPAIRSNGCDLWCNKYLNNEKPNDIWQRLNSVSVDFILLGKLTITQQWHWDKPRSRPERKVVRTFLKWDKNWSSVECTYWKLVFLFRFHRPIFIPADTELFTI